MSAFMCSDEHVNRILDAARRVDGTHDLIHYLRDVPGDSLPDKLTSLGRMMHRENLRSIMHRYDDVTVEEGEGLEYEQQVDRYVYVPGGEQQKHTTAVEGLKLLASWRYQSCEHPAETRHAQTWDLVALIEKTLINGLPGYAEAPWSA